MHPSNPTETVPPRCTFCGYDVPTDPVLRDDGTVFCSERCAEASASGEEPFAGRFGFKGYQTGVSALDTLLPWGLPSNSFVLLAGREGIRHRGLQTELVWRALRRNEPAIVVSFVDHPMAVVEHFFAFGWNVLPYLESGRLRIVDCFTATLREEHRSLDHRIPWNEYLEGFLDGAVTTVRDPADLRAVEDGLHQSLDDLAMHGTGVVVVDSLNEPDARGRAFETKQFVKEVRGDVCNRLFVPMFASTTLTPTSHARPMARALRVVTVPCGVSKVPSRSMATSTMGF